MYHEPPRVVIIISLDSNFKLNVPTSIIIIGFFSFLFGLSLYNGNQKPVFNTFCHCGRRKNKLHYIFFLPQVLGNKPCLKRFLWWWPVEQRPAVFAVPVEDRSFTMVIDHPVRDLNLHRLAIIRIKNFPINKSIAKAGILSVVIDKQLGQRSAQGDKTCH